MKYKYKSIRNKVKISMNYQWKSIGNPVKNPIQISMKYQWKSIGNPVEIQ